MGNVWLKIKVWTKITIFSAIAIYVLVFVYKNSTPVTVWWWYNRSAQSSGLVLMAASFLAGMLCIILVRTTLRTMQQVRDLRDRNRAQRMERDLVEMKEKASRLQTKPLAESAPSVAPSEPIE